MLEYEFFAQVAGFVMFCDPQIGVHAALKCLYVIFIRCALVNYLVVMLNGHVEISFSAVA